MLLLDDHFTNYPNAHVTVANRILVFIHGVSTKLYQDLYLGQSPPRSAAVANSASLLVGAVQVL